MEARLQKIISGYGAASRRQAEKMILDGRVAVNGRTASLGDVADDEVDEITIDGKKLISRPSYLYLILNKPRGYVTTLRDERGRKSVSDLVKDCGARVYPVGRLDQYSEGLLLLTNDGELTNKLTHPKGEIKKIYHVWVNGYYDAALVKLRASIEIDGRKTIPANVRVLAVKGESTMLEFTLFEGRNRQIRRLCEYAEIRVTRLKRVQEGCVSLGDLPVGKWRILTEGEIEELYREAGLVYGLQP